MPTPFAALETRINTAVIAHLANATADLGGSVTADGIFRVPSADAFGLVTGTRPVFESTESALTGVTIGQVITLGATSYVVAESHTDGSGMQRLTLEQP